MSVLERLQDNDNRVVDITLSKDKKTIKMEENCDEYFSVDLTKADFIEFIGELNLLLDQMID